MPKININRAQKRWLLRVALPSAIFAIITILVFIAINYQTSPVYHNQADYLISGDKAWVGGREWLVYNPETSETLGSSTTAGAFTVSDYGPTANFALTHPDWNIRFLVNNSSATQCQTTDLEKDLKDCAASKTTELKLDRKLDTYLKNLVGALVNSQWDKVSPLTDISSDTPLSTQLSEWTDGLSEKNFSVVAADTYVTVNDDGYLAGGAFKAMLVWQLKNSETGGIRILDSELTIQPNENSFKWNFSPSELPKI